jgi:AraC-like DNA-binding protein
VERGAALLSATGLTVSQIADRCGFKNPFHFSRLLRKMQGVSPRQLRQRAWVETPKKMAKSKPRPAGIS